MANEKRLIDANALVDAIEDIDWYHVNAKGKLVDGANSANSTPIYKAFDIYNAIKEAPTVDAVEMPKGKPGDYLEWDNGTGFRQIYHIHAVMICEDCMRYDLEKFAPVVNHPGIVRILSLEEAEQEWHEMCAKAKPREEPTMTACCAKMDGDGNG